MSENLEPLVFTFDVKDSGSAKIIGIKAALSGLAGPMSAATSGLGMLKGAMAAIATLATIKKSISIIADYDRAISQLGAISMATGEQMNQLKIKAREMGAATEYSGAEAAKGMQFLAMAGFNVSETLTAISDSLDLATAGQIGMAESADILSNVLSGFNMTANESARVANVLAGTASKSNTNILQLGEALSYSAPLAAAFGKSVEETAAAIGMLGNAGIQGSRAGTTLIALFRELTVATDEQIAVMEKYHLTQAILNPETHSLSEIMHTLADSNISATDAMILFQRAGAGVIAMLKQVDEFDRLQKSLDAGEVSAKSMADRIRGDLKNSFDEMSSSTEELVLVLADSGLRDAIKSVVDELTKLLREAAKSPLIDAFAVSMKTLSENVWLLVFAVRAFVAIKFVGIIISLGTALGGVFKYTFLLKEGFIGLSMGAGILFARLTALAAGASGSFILLTGVIIGIYEVFKYLNTHVDESLGAWAIGVNGVKNGFIGLKDTFWNLANLMQTVFDEMGNVIEYAFDEILASLAAKLEKFINWQRGKWNAIAPEFMEIGMFDASGYSGGNPENAPSNAMGRIKSAYKDPISNPESAAAIAANNLELENYLNTLNLSKESLITVAELTARTRAQWEEFNKVPTVENPGDPNGGGGVASAIEEIVIQLRTLEGELSKLEMAKSILGEINKSKIALGQMTNLEAMKESFDYENAILEKQKQILAVKLAMSKDESDSLSIKNEIATVEQEINGLKEKRAFSILVEEFRVETELQKKRMEGADYITTLFQENIALQNRLTLSTDQLDVLAREAELRRIIGEELTPTQIKTIKELSAYHSDLSDRLKMQTELSEGFASATVNGFDAMIKSGGDFISVLNDMAQAITEMIWKITVLNPMEDALTSMFKTGSISALTDFFLGTPTGTPAIPDSVIAQGYASNQTPVIQVIDQRVNASEPVSVSQNTKADQSGNTIIQAIIRDSVQKDIQTGAYDKTFGSTFGLSRTGGKR